MRGGSEKKQMEAVQYSKYGGGAASLKHVEIPVPTVKKNEILVKVESAAINPIDWKVQSGMLKFFSFPTKFPYTPGTEVSGEVVHIGHQVNGFSQGDKIVTWLDFRYGGGFAKYAIASPDMTVKRPREISAVDAAALPVAGITALQSIRDSAGAKLDGSYKGNILVTAASGGVGSFAVQIAKLTGAHVTATCGGRNVKLVESLGADEVLDYETPEGKSLKSPSGKLYDAVIHCATAMPFSAFQPVLAPSGKVINLNPTFGMIMTSVMKFLMLSKQKIVPFFMSPNANDLVLLLDLVKDGKLKTVIDSTFPFDKAEEAWAKSMEGHATGKIVVTMGA